jgi:2-dehydropantoate 2-reductase
MLQDVQAGRPTEVDAICGAVYHEGDRRGIAAPLNQAMTVLVSALTTART